MMNRAALTGACVLLAGCTGGSQDDLKTWMDGHRPPDRVIPSML